MKMPSLGAGLLSAFEAESGLTFGVRHGALRLWDVGAGARDGAGISRPQRHAGVPWIAATHFLGWHWPVSSLLQQGSVC